jgi:quinol monooxygenase YgiN
MKTPNELNGPVTLINVFAVEPEKQQALLDLLAHFSETVVRKSPGFISATFHTSLDGTRVTNVALWESREAFLAMFQSPEAQAHIAQCRETATHLEHNFYVIASRFLPVAQQD